jgi:hypothetical protein
MSLKPRLAVEEGFEVLANEIHYGVTQHQIIPSKPADLSMAAAKYM